LKVSVQVFIAAYNQIFVHAHSKVWTQALPWNNIYAIIDCVNDKQLKWHKVSLTSFLGSSLLSSMFERKKSKTIILI
jgi:hypothetical protein